MAKEKVEWKQKVSLVSLVVALGIIYGDIGTSPLYVLKAIVGKNVISDIIVLGGVSCVFWTLFLQTTIKYIWLTLKADNEGEGGIFSLYALVQKHSKKLVIPTILGATALLADGIITPPISVASAIEGLQNIPSMAHIKTVPIVIMILSLLFIFQRFGTQKVGSAFGPIMVIWFSMLFVLGLSQIWVDQSVLRAFNPYYAIQLLTQYPKGFWILGAVFLATTGAEALYSDLGHCGKQNIRISWVFVKICLVVNYMGQAAWLLHQKGDFLLDRNPFFEIVPQWFLIPSIIIATMATIIASQALISGSYTLINEAMNLNFWPRVSVRQPSNKKGQIYIPSINNIMWGGCILMVLYFRTSTHMEAAYGFSISIAMMMTTILLTYFLVYKLKWHPIFIVLILLLFSTVEISFFIANVVKIKERWMFLFFELFIFTTMYVWFYSRKILNSYTKFVDLGKYVKLIKDLSDDTNIPKFATHLIYLTKANTRNEIEEKILNSILSKNPKRADIYWFVHINRTQNPYTLSYDVSELLEDKVIKININIGFRIRPRTELYFKKIMMELIQNEELNMHLIPNGSTKYSSAPDYKFVVLEKYLSFENEFSIRKGLLLNGYFILNRLGLKEERAFGLDKSDVTVEPIPFVYNSADHHITLTRTDKNHQQ
jgi:KUP system potassium uptake protein